jgi:hypothetical protein
MGPAQALVLVWDSVLAKEQERVEVKVLVQEQEQVKGDCPVNRVCLRLLR